MSATRQASWTKSYTITADVTIPHGGGEGMIVTEGGSFGGYGLYMLKGKPVFDYNMLDLDAIPLGRSMARHAGRCTQARQAHDSVRLQI